MTAAARVRRHRERQRRGVAVWPVEVPEVELQEALVVAGLVEADAPPGAYHAAAGLVLAEFVSRFSVTRYGTLLTRQNRLDA